MAGISTQETEIERIKEILKANPKGLSIEEVAKKLSLNRITAVKYLNALVMSGQADMREFGRAKVFYLSARLPMTNMLSLASDLIVVLDKDLFIQEANDSLLSYFKIPREDLKGRQLEHSPLAPYFTAEHFAALGRALDGTGSLFEIHIEEEGRDNYFRLKLIPLVFEQGEQAVGIIFEDITEMKKYQQELEKSVIERTDELVKTNESLQSQIKERILADRERRESEQKYLHIFNNTTDAIEIVALDEGLNPAALLDINESACRMAQASRDNLLRSGPLDLGIGRDSNKPAEQVKKELRAQSASTFETSFSRSDGSRLPVEVSMHVTTLQEKPAVIAVIRDISERRQAQDALAKANKQATLFTTITRHDILNQLSQLDAYISLSKKQPGNNVLADFYNKEDSIVSTIRSQIVFTRDYQNVGLQPPRWKNVKETLSEVLKSVNTGDVIVELGTGELEIYADLLIEKVFFNLIENALRHGGHVTRISVSFRRDGENGVLVLEDNGIGVPENEKDLIFTRGYGKNTGYGLFLAKEILAITGISIRETGTPGKGAAFELTLPKNTYRFSGSE